MKASQTQQLKLSYNEMIKANYSRLQAVARCYSHSVDEREDLFQDILYQLWRSFKSFKAESSMNTWVYRVALNTAISHIRSRNNKPINNSAELSNETQSHQGDFTASVNVLERFLQTLNKIDKAIMMLYLDDLSHQQIADITGFSTNVISVRINRMKQKFKQQHIGD